MMKKVSMKIDERRVRTSENIEVDIIILRYYIHSRRRREHFQDNRGRQWIGVIEYMCWDCLVEPKSLDLLVLTGFSRILYKFNLFFRFSFYLVLSRRRSNQYLLFICYPFNVVC